MLVLCKMESNGAYTVCQGVVAADLPPSVLQYKNGGVGIDDLYLYPAPQGFVGNCCCVRAFNKASSFRI